ncbi:MAG TPA: alpha/beta hydrolase [Pseudolabrys sp.]|nr:alpha/beta hydrolase [Pseudolabrys sp.]
MASERWRTGFQTGKFRQFYRDWQPQAAKGLPVLALHGSLTQSGMWNALAEAAQTVRLLSPDQRGFGLSEDPGSDPCAEFAADALALARSMLPARYVVMGHSFACSIALDVALRAPAQVVAVVLVDPVVRLGPPPTPSTPPPRPPESFATTDEAMRHYRDTEEGEWTDETLRRFVEDIMLSDGQGRRRFPYTSERLRRLRSFTASAVSDFDLFGKTKAVGRPVLVFRGGQSKRFPEAAEQPFLDSFASKPVLVRCPRSGHFPSATDTGIVVAALKRFLDDLG